MSLVNEEGVEIHEYTHRRPCPETTGTTIVNSGKERGETDTAVLLTALTMQDYSKMRITPVLVADAGSTDGTPDIVRSFREPLDGACYPGGMPGRKPKHRGGTGRRRVRSILDADIELAEPWPDPALLEKMQRPGAASGHYQHFVPGKLR